MFRLFLILATLVGFALPLWSQTVIVVKSDNKAYYNETVQGFKARLGALGNYNVKEVDLAGSSSNAGLIDQALSSAGGNKLVFTVGTGASALSHKKLAGSAPLLFSLVANPAKYGLTGNAKVGGIAFDYPPETIMERIKEIFGPVKVGVLYSGNFQSKFGALQKAGSSQGVTCVGAKVASSKDILKGLASLESKGVQILLLLKDPVVLGGENTNVLLEEALKRSMGVIGFTEAHVKRGALMAFTTDYKRLGEQAAESAHKLLAAGSGGKLDFPKRIRVVVNQKVKARLTNISLAPDSLKGAQVL